ncbi:MAG: glycosyltransferase [Clostridia bacterium]|nr:glycosyltransferase [Clostridia bacterium]
MKTTRTDVLGVGFDNVTLDEAVTDALKLISEKRAAYVVTPNPEIVMICRENPEVFKAVKSASLVLPDGIGIVYGAKILGRPLKQKVPGIDFAQALFEKMSDAGMSIFLFGAKPGVAEMAQSNLFSRFPGLRFVGMNDGYFSDDAPIIEKINAAAPDLLLVCLGAPKQELWMYKNAAELNVGLMAGLGGSLDVFAGIAQRAPERWQKLGLEWLYRLKSDPSRAGRMKNLPKFGFTVIGQRLKGK